MPTSPGRYAHVKRTAPQHITWKKIRTYTTTYTKTGNLPKTERQRRNAITVYTVTRPKKVKLFRTAGGIRKYKAAQTKTTLREVIIVARTKSRKKPVDAEEIEEIEAIEELDELDEDDLEDEEPEVEDDEDEDEEEEDEAPPKRKGKKGKAATPAKATKSRAAANGKVGTQELAEHLGIDGRTLRIVLRKHNIQKDPESNRYEWDSMKDKEVLKIAKLIKSGEAERAKKESLDKLKERKAAQKAEAQAAAAKSKKGKKKAKVAEPEEDLEDEVDDDELEEDDDEDEEPTPAPKRTKKSKK